MTAPPNVHALQAAAGIGIPLAENVRIRSGSVTSEAVQGFSDVRAVDLVVRVPVLRGHPAPSLTVTVQKSTNGSDWTTAHAFTFTATGDDLFTLEAPDDYLRVVFAPAGGLVEAVVASVVASIVTVDAPAGESPGGGSQTLAEVLDTGNDAEGGTIKHVAVLEIAGGDSLTVANNSTDPDSDFNPLEINSSLIRVNLNGIESTSFDIKSANGRKTLLAGFNDTDEMVVGHSSGTLGFFSKAGVARPEVPAIPSVQDVVDALVALGLVTQAA